VMNESFDFVGIASIGDDSENPPDFGFAKNCRSPTIFGFELQHIPKYYTVTFWHKVMRPKTVLGFDGFDNCSICRPTMD